MQIEEHEVIIVGAGFSGLGVAIQLRKAGFNNLLILEAGSGVGGAWHFNTYPGVAVDIPSLSYEFSFERNQRWSRLFAPGHELKAYAESCVDKYGLTDQLRFNTGVQSVVFDEDSQRWIVSASDGVEYRCRFLVSATGVLTQPKNPEIKGIDSFAGTLMHTARWDHTVDLRGKRVAIVGTGASALQVIPEIAPVVKHLTVFQRTPIWVIPKPDMAVPALMQNVLSRSSLLQWSARMVSQAVVELGFVLTAHYHRPFKLSSWYEKLAHRHLKEQVKDPKTREQLTPKYGFGCKRPSASNTYLKTFNLPNVDLQTNPIERIDHQGLITADGQHHSVDVLICATGFKVFENGNMPPFRVLGKNGLNLEQWWDKNRYQAYEGVSVPGFPNLFMVLGPNGYNGASYFQLIEMQARHIIRCLRAVKEKKGTQIEVRDSANKVYFEAMKARSGRQVFFANNCGAANSYYFDKHGDVPFRPSTSLEAHWRSRTFPMSHYRIT